MLQILQRHWLTVAVCATPVLAVLVVGKYRYPTLEIEDLAHFPQPEVDKKKGDWAWIEKAAYAGVLGRSWSEQSFPVERLDRRPMLDAPILFIFDYYFAEQITKATKTHSTSLPKDPVMLNLSPLVGRHSLVTPGGDEWKGLHKRILPGFQPQYLLSLVGGILDKTEIFVEHLERMAKTGEDFNVDELTTNLTFDVIGLITFNLDLKAQIPSQQSPVLQTCRTLQQSYMKRNNTLHWLLRYFTAKERRIRNLHKKLDTVPKDTIRKEHAKLLEEDHKGSARSVMALSLAGIDELTSDILQQTSDTCRGLLFAGHDTTSILLQWMFYEISWRPASFRALKEELDVVFGTDSNPVTVIAQMRNRENSLSITSLKSRRTPPGSDTILTMPNGDKLNVDDLILSSVAYIIQRDERYFGRTQDDFVPERWLSPEAADIPDSCWRPYERGPRRCTGFELAIRNHCFKLERARRAVLPDECHERSIDKPSRVLSKYGRS